MCCALGLLLLTLAAWRRRAATILFERRWPLASLVFALILLAAGSAVAAQHISHYLARAEAHQRSVIAEILAQPICSGAP